MEALHPHAVVDCDVLYQTRAPALRSCWHPVAFTVDVGQGPVARRLLGTDIVVWRDGTGQYGAALDRCPHRWAKLSSGSIVDGELRCPYHGWRFATTGRAVEIPQLDPGGAIPPMACLDALPVTTRFSMVWVRLDARGAAPSTLAEIPEYDDPSFRAIPIGVIPYRTNAAAIIDNNTDGTHIAFVHAGSFGAGQDPRIPVSRVERTGFGIRISAEPMPVARTPSTAQPGSRIATTEMWLPFTQVGRLAYSDGSTHILVKGCCPVDDEHTDVFLTVLRNDLDDPADSDEIVRFELAVEHEDKAALDTVPAGFPLDPAAQVHIKHDRPGIAYRRALRELLSLA